MTSLEEHLLFPLDSLRWQKSSSGRRFSDSHYMPMVGRFVSKDPLLFGGGSTNLYSYSVNDPVNFIDPTGKNPLLLIGAVVATGAVVGAVSNGYGTYLAGGNAKQIANSAVVGAAAGAAATLTSIGAAVGAVPTAIGVGIGIGVDLAIQFAFAPSSLPNGTSMIDVQNGVNAVKTGPSCPTH